MPNAGSDFTQSHGVGNGRKRPSVSWEHADTEPLCNRAGGEEAIAQSMSADWQASLGAAIQSLVAAPLNPHPPMEEPGTPRHDPPQPVAPLAVPINGFDPEPFELLRPLVVLVQQVDDDDYNASFFDANLCAAGSNPSEAIDSLKSLMLGRFEFLESLPSKKLGPGPARQLAVLRAYLRRR